MAGSGLLQGGSKQNEKRKGKETERKKRTKEKASEEEQMSLEWSHFVGTRRPAPLRARQSTASLGSVWQNGDSSAL